MVDGQVVNTADSSKLVDQFKDPHLLSVKPEAPAGPSQRTSICGTIQNEEGYKAEENATEEPYPRKVIIRFSQSLLNMRAITELGFPFEKEVSQRQIFSTHGANLTLVGFHSHIQGLGQGACS